ncbi:MAG: metal-dependent hydrolase [Gammaproteobacteria bacterium]|nr:metal-dependent hydrolase [Gammaproteobacteria bacterium]
MDIVTQGLLGATAALSASKQKETRLAVGTGFVAGLLPDIDALIGSAEDPLLNIEFHRHFTHALIFIPIGGLIAALILWPFLQQRLPFKRLYLFTLLGYATHGLLDATTSYGTQLLLPFSDERIAWRIIAIVDPVFSFILIIAIILGWRHRKALNARAGLLLAAGYLLFGVWQHNNAGEATLRLAQQRGHQVDRFLVKPTMANQVLWRSVYESNGVFYVDAIRLRLFSDDRIYEGGQANRFMLERDRPNLEQGSALRHDIERFLYFSHDYVAADPDRENVLIDVRYSMLPNGLKPIWGIDMNEASSTRHAQFVNYRDRDEFTRERFIGMVLGQTTEN